MKNFGKIKSKIENRLLESYTNNTFKEEIKNFKKCILENKNFSKLYFLYDDLTSKKGFTPSRSQEYINECITIYENTINKIKDKDYKSVLNWIGDVEIENKYENIDNLFSQNILNIESRLESKKIIFENLQKIENEKKDFVNLPLSSMVNVANKTIKNYIESLDESEKEELINILSEDTSKLENEFKELKDSILNKLNSMISESEVSLNEKINETIQKVETEKFTTLSYYQLKKLNENI